MKPDTVYLHHIVEEIIFIQESVSSLSYSEFLKNRILGKAIIQSFGVIGEAANNISKEFQKQHPEIAWQGMIGLRNRLIHKYFDIDFSILWETIANELPELYEQVVTILKTMEEK